MRCGSHARRVGCASTAYGVQTCSNDVMDMAPRFSRRPTPPRRRGRRWEWFAIALLLPVLAVQASVAARATLAADARWRPWVSALCGALGCDVPAWREPTAFAMLRR